MSQSDQEPVGTFACPICGHDKPHAHTVEAASAYNDDQIRNDGWTSSACRMPKEKGFYLIKDFTFLNVDSARYSYVKLLAGWRRPCPSLGMAPEVAEYGHIHEPDYFRLLYHPIANDRVEQSYLPVLVHPKFWRPLP